MAIEKVYRVRLYRQNTGPFECLVITTSRAKAESRAKIRAAIAANHEAHQLHKELTTPVLTPTKGQPAKKFVPGRAENYPTSQVKTVKPRLITHGENKTVRCEVLCLGRAK